MDDLWTITACRNPPLRHFCTGRLRPIAHLSSEFTNGLLRLYFNDLGKLGGVFGCALVAHVFRDLIGGGSFLGTPVDG